MNTHRCITIVGVGLIGGSIGLALRKRFPELRIVGTGSREATLTDALKLGAITEIAADLTASVQESSLVVVCAPVGHIVEIVSQLAPDCQPGTLITDAGSTKATIVAELESQAKTWPEGVRFVGSHPLAGNEKKGPQHATADLLCGRCVVVTPSATTVPHDLVLLRSFWESLGSHVLEMSASEHDRALAHTSHLPHLIAAVLAGATPEQFLPLTASGWEDTTRIAGGDATLWRQIMLANRENLLAALDQFTTLLVEWHEALLRPDPEQLEQLLAQAKHLRDQAPHSANGQSNQSPAPDPAQRDAAHET